MPQSLLRTRDGHGATVTFSELLFDLIYVFAVTQLSHCLLHHLTLVGALVALSVLIPIAFTTDRLMVNGLTTVVMVVVAGWESFSRRRHAA